MTLKLRALTSICFASLLVCTTLFAMDTAQPDIQTFIKRMHDTQGFEKASLEKILSETPINPRVLALMERPYEAQPWHRYKKHFLGKQRIHEGSLFWAKHAQTLQTLEASYGVPPEVLVAIIGVESFYGRYPGHFKVIESLATLAFHYPKRSAFFTKELAAYLKLCKKQAIDPRVPTGSYAGAMGWPQFMPSVYARLAVAYHHKGAADIWHTADDVMASIANYLARNHWHPHQPIAQTTHWHHAASQPTFNQRATHGYTMQKMKAMGFDVKASDLKWRLTPLHLDTKPYDEYWLAYANFNAIMSYNPRIHYAMAVYQLSDAIKKDYLSNLRATDA